MKIIKLLPILCSFFVLSNCATLLYKEVPTFQEAPVACAVDIGFSFLVVPLAVDVVYGACRVEDLER